MADSRRAQRTLVKSPPELWAEVSDGEALGRHLEPFGEIRITRLEPETTVAWEGDRARGTVELEAAGWGTRVTITATPEVDEEEEVPSAEAAPEGRAASPAEAPTIELDPVAPAPEPEDGATPAGTTRRGWLSRLFRRRGRREAAPVREAPVGEPAPAVEPVAVAVAVEVSEPDPVPAPRLAAVGGPAPALTPADAEGILAAVLDDLGAAHHRPFSR